MLRIFRHFFPVPTLLLGLSESLALTLVLYFMARPLGVAPAQHVNFDHVPLSLGTAVLAIMAMMAVGLYNSDVFLDYRMASLRAVLALGLVVPLALAATYAFEAQSAAAGQFDFHWLLKALIAWVICLAITRSMFVWVLSLDLLKRRVLVLGTGNRALRLRRLSLDRTRDRFMAVGFVNACGDPRRVDNIVAVDDPQNRMSLVNLARKLGAKEIVLATDDRRGLPVNQLLECKLLGVSVIDYIAFCERETGRVDLEALQPSWFILSDGFRMGRISEFLKRSFDLVISALILLAFLPVMAMTAIAIRLESRGPVLFRQERVGLRGQVFTLLKFRSMRVDAERDGAPQWAQKNDPRVTRVGSFIRLVRIDELPQLWNVLRGDMSFVGPRPERPYFVEQLSQSMPFYNERHAIKPGITGWAQVSYCYGASIEDARVKLSYDLYYLKNRDLFLDFVTLMQTVRVILWPEGVR